MVLRMRLQSHQVHLTMLQYYTCIQYTVRHKTTLRLTGLQTSFIWQCIYLIITTWEKRRKRNITNSYQQCCTQMTSDISHSICTVLTATNKLAEYSNYTHCHMIVLLHKSKWYNTIRYIYLLPKAQHSQLNRNITNSHEQCCTQMTSDILHCN